MSNPFELTPSTSSSPAPLLLSPPSFDSDTTNKSTPKQQQPSYFPPQRSVFEDARLQGRRAWSSVSDCGPGGQLRDDEFVSPGARAGGSWGMEEAGMGGYQSPEGQYGGGPSGYLASPGVSSVMESMSLSSSSSFYSQNIVFDNPSPFEDQATYHQQHSYISPTQSLQPIPSGSPASFYQQHLSTPNGPPPHLTYSSSMSSLSSSDLSTPPNAPYQVLAPHALVFGGALNGGGNDFAVDPSATTTNQHGSPGSSLPVGTDSPLLRPMMKRFRSSLSSSPFPYDDYEGSSYEDASLVYFDSSDPQRFHGGDATSSFSPNPAPSSFNGDAAIGHSPTLTPVPRAIPRPDTSKKQKRSDGPLLWFADGSELCPEFRRQWSPERLQQEWVKAKLADTRGKEVTGVDAFTAKQELAFLTAFYYLPVMDRNKIRFFGKVMGRNEVVSTIVNCAEGDPILFRSRKRISAQFSSMKKGCLKVPGEIAFLLNRSMNPEMALRQQSGRYCGGKLADVHQSIYDLVGLPAGSDLSNAVKPQWLAQLDAQVDESERVAEQMKKTRREMKDSAYFEEEQEPAGPPSNTVATSYRPIFTRKDSSSSDSSMASSSSEGLTSPLSRPSIQRSLSQGALVGKQSYSPSRPSPLAFKEVGIPVIIPSIVPIECAVYSTDERAPLDGVVLASLPHDSNSSFISTDIILFDQIHLAKDRFPRFRELASRSRAPALHVQIAIDLPLHDPEPGSRLLSSRIGLSTSSDIGTEVVSVVSSSVVDGNALASVGPLDDQTESDSPRGQQSRNHRAVNLPVGLMSTLLEQFGGGPRPQEVDVDCQDVTRVVAPFFTPATAKAREVIGSSVLPSIAVLQEFVSRADGTSILFDEELIDDVEEEDRPGAISEGTKRGEVVHLVIVYSFVLAEPGRGSVRIQTISFERSSGSKSTSPFTIVAAQQQLQHPRPSLSFIPPSPKSRGEATPTPPATYSVVQPSGRTRLPSARNKSNLTINLPPSLPVASTVDASAGPLPFTPLDKIMSIPSAPPPINLQGPYPRRLFGSTDLGIGPYSGGGVAGSLAPPQQQQHHLASNPYRPSSTSHAFDDASPLPSPGIFAPGNMARQRMAGWTEDQPSPSTVGPPQQLHHHHLHTSLHDEDDEEALHSPFVGTFDTGASSFDQFEFDGPSHAEHHQGHEMDDMTVFDGYFDQGMMLEEEEVLEGDGGEFELELEFEGEDEQEEAIVDDAFSSSFNQHVFEDELDQSMFLEDFMDEGEDEGELMEGDFLF